jgi:hypothetical protein
MEDPTRGRRGTRDDLGAISVPLAAFTHRDQADEAAAEVKASAGIEGAAWHRAKNLLYTKTPHPA